MTLLSDANILIDFAKVGGLESLARLASLEVLDVVLAEVDDPCKSQVLALGVQVVQVQETWLPEAMVLKKSGLSIADALCLHYCRTSSSTLLSNDGRLRRACAESGVVVHGSLWVVCELYNQKVCLPEVLCNCLYCWEKELKARLPADELAQVRQVLGCISGS